MPSMTPSLRFTWVTSAASRRVRRHRVVVVLAGDLDAAGGQPLDRVVAAVVAERQLVGRPPRAEASSWWPRQIPKIGTSPSRPWMAPMVPVTAAGSPGPLDRNTPSGWRASTSAARGAGRHDLDGGELAEVAEDRRLDAEVVGHDPAGSVAHGVGLGAADHRRQVLAVGAGLVERGLLQRGLVRGAEGAGHGPGVADVAGEAAGVDAGDAGHAVAGAGTRPGRPPSASCCGAGPGRGRSRPGSAGRPPRRRPG